MARAAHYFQRHQRHEMGSLRFTVFNTPVKYSDIKACLIFAGKNILVQTTYCAHNILPNRLCYNVFLNSVSMSYEGKWSYKTISLIIIIIIITTLA